VAGVNFDSGGGSVCSRWRQQRVLSSIARPRAVETASGSEEGGHVATCIYQPSDKKPVGHVNMTS
jgi:hypothetical protein